MSKWMQQLFKPHNPKKYKGNVKNIQYRSSWELKYMIELDADPNVLEWSSEELAIPYTDKATGRFRRYFPDFRVKKKEGNKIKTYIIEIKPAGQVREPKRGNKSEKAFLKEVMTYGTNLGKWEAAERYCKKHGYEFVILTEKELKVF